MTARSHAVFSNAGALLVLQIASYILPFLLIPYLARVLGATLYGVVAFGLAMAQIACVVTDYGFALSATYKIAKTSNDNDLKNRIVTSVIICKFFLLLPVALLLGGFLLVQEKYADYELFLWLMFIPVIGQTFQPVWFFQGIERMALITVYTVASRVTYLLLVLWWVTKPADYFFVAVANGTANIGAAVIGILMMWRLGCRLEWPGWRFVRDTFKESTLFFWSRAAAATYTAGGSFFLGLVSTPLQVAHYSAAEQLYRGAQSLFQPLSQALYPHMAQHKNFSLFFKVLKWAVALSALGVLVGVFSGEWVISLIFGDDFAETFPVLMIFLVTFAITTPSILLGYPFLGALGRPEKANLSVIYAGILQVILLLICYVTGLDHAVQIASTVLAVELVVLALRLFWARKLCKESAAEVPI